jgi:3-keto-disaccharide hydrolase
MLRIPCLLLLAMSLAALVGMHRPVTADDTSRPFNGKNLEGWKLKAPMERSKWVVGKASLKPDNPSQLAVESATGEDAQLVNSTGGGVDIYTDQKWGDATIEVDVMVPKGSNSGIYVMGEYEIQILDSYGKAQVGPGDIGGLYNAAAPKVNAAKAPGEWQKFLIEYQAPRYEGDKKVQNMKFVKITLNGQVIHENVEMKGPTPSGVTGQERAMGPLMFQGDHGPVAYRNIKIIPKKS